ncbi:MAG: ABC transporter ATP-binding protein [bacterium]
MEPKTPNAPSTDLSNGRLIERLLRLTWQYRAGCVRVLALQMALLALTLGGFGLTGLGIDFIRHTIQSSATPPHWPFHLVPPTTWAPMTVVMAIAGAIVLLALIRALLSSIYSIQLAELLQRHVVVNLRSKVYAKLQSMSFRFFDETASGSIINRVTGDVQSTRLFIDGVIIQGLIMILSLAFYLVYMLSIHLRLTLFCLCTTPLLWMATLIFTRRVRPLYRKNRELADNLTLTLSEMIQGIPVIKGFAREPEIIERFAVANRAVRDQKYALINQVSFFSPAINFLTQVNLMILLGYGGYLVIHGQLPLGAGLVVFAGLLQQFSNQVANIGTIANSIQESLTAAQRVFEVLDAPIEIRNLPSALRVPHLRGAVAFDHVGFGYEPDAPILRDITFEAGAGQCIAIAGATASGKSTLLSLIPRFYDAQKGRVLLDGMDVRQLDLNDLRRNVGIVFQESFLFSTSVASNIAFGDPAATQDQIEHAAKIAQAHDFICSLPKGYNTILGEGGSNLSGGQRQRLAIARALLLNPTILILDDPTAAIDPKTEHEIMEAMNHAMRGRTTFVVAHRLSTLRRADLIMVLDRGRIVQMGTHESLMKSKGAYQRLAAIQEVDVESQRLMGNPADPGQEAP